MHVSGPERRRDLETLAQLPDNPVQGDSAVVGIRGSYPATWLNNLAARPSAHAPGSVLIGVAGVAAVSSAIGLLAGLLGTLVEQLWGSRGRQPPAAWLLRARRRLWDTMASPQRQAILQAVAVRRSREAGNQGHDTQELHEKLREINEETDKRSRRLAWMSEGRPAHPTWVGDRYARSADRFRTVNGLDDMTLVWPQATHLNRIRCTWPHDVHCRRSRGDARCFA